MTILLLSDLYEKIGFLSAAKSYALLGAFIAADSGDESLQDLFARGVCFAARAAFLAGSWATCAGIAEVGLILHSNFISALNPDDEQFQELLLELSWIFLAGRDFDPDLAEIVERILRDSGMWEEVKPFLDREDARSPVEWLASIRPSVTGRFFGDYCEEYRVQFEALGVRFNISAQNEPEESRAVERLASAAQVLLADLAKKDLALLKTRILVEVSLAEDEAPGCEPLPSNIGRKWRVVLARVGEDSDEREIVHEIASVLTTILMEVSLLPQGRYLELIEKAFEQGLSHKLGMGPPLDVLLVWVERAEVNALKDEDKLPSEFVNAEFDLQPFSGLEWYSELAPSYDRDQALEMISLRHQRVAELLPITLAKLRRSEELAEVVAELRRRGWRDWHILNSIANAATNYRVQKLIADRAVAPADGELQDEMKKVFLRIQSEPETEESPDVPEDQFTVENLELHRRLASLHLLERLGLELRQRTPDFEAIDEFLAVRYRYWEDDIAHDDPFSD